jgi:hypothetical protein
LLKLLIKVPSQRPCTEGFPSKFDNQEYFHGRLLARNIMTGTLMLSAKLNALNKLNSKFIP